MYTGNMLTKSYNSSSGSKIDNDVSWGKKIQTVYCFEENNTCISEISLGMCPANERRRRRYNVTTSLIGWAYT